MLAIESNVKAAKRWFERLPVRTQRIIPVASAVVVALTLICSFGTWYHHSRPTYVLSRVNRINSREDVQRESDYLTPQGRAIILWSIDKRGDKPPSGEKSIFSEPVVSGDTCDIPVRSGNVSGTVRLLKTDHWRFHDLYFDKSGDKSIGLWASYIKDHPYASWWTMHGGEMLDAFCQGVLIRTGRVK